VLDIILSRSYCDSTHTQNVSWRCIWQEALEAVAPAEPAAGKVETPIITDSSSTEAAVVDTTEAAVVNTTEAAAVNTTEEAVVNTTKAAGDTY
jgi:hypothetical protein